MSKITRIETFLVPPRWLFVRIETANGCVGWGEASLEGSSLPVRAVIQQWSDYLVGADASRIENAHVWMSNNTFYRGGPVFSSALAGIDQALWDLAGKELGVPVHRLLGGNVRDRIRVYAWVGGDNPSEITDQIEARMASGLTAVKMNASGPMQHIASVREIDDVLERAAVARDTLGPERDFAIDFHGRISLPSARRLSHLLESFSPMFIEEPLVPEHTGLMKSIVQNTSIPVATGERLYSRQEFIPALRAGVTIAQPDLSHARGITEVRKIASLAETFGAALAPHCPLGPIALASCLQIGFATPNYVLQEQSIGIHYNTDADLLDYVLDAAPLTSRDGFIPLLENAGLGIEVDEAAVRAADGKSTWSSPTWAHADGGYAEW
jgi:galactonate dehydratase